MRANEIKCGGNTVSAIRFGIVGLAIAVSSASGITIAGQGAVEADRGDHGRAPGAVYAMTNAPGNNEIVVYERGSDGTLEMVGNVPTGGSGWAGKPIDPLASQGSVALSRNHEWLAAANAGSDQISLFRVRPGSVVRADVEDSGGNFPVSVTFHGDLLYVLNAGSNIGKSDSVSGFRVRQDGKLVALAGSTRSLSASATSPAEVAFSPDGGFLVVTEKATALIDVFMVGDDGLLSASPVLSPSSGATPFGFVFDRRGHLVVGEAGPPSAVSSYDIRPDGSLERLSGSVVNGQKATCWIAGNGGGNVYTANAGSSDLSDYSVAPDGEVALRIAVAASAPGTTPIDTSVTPDGRFLYTLNASTGTVGMFRVSPDGTLTDIGEIGGLPASAGAQGIAAR